MESSLLISQTYNVLIQPWHRHIPALSTLRYSNTLWKVVFEAMSQVPATENLTHALTTDNLRVANPLGILPSFDKLLFALSSISHIRGHAPTESSSASAQQRKH